MITLVLKSLLNQNTSKTWGIIKSVRIDPFSRQILKNLHYINEGFTNEINLETHEINWKTNEIDWETQDKETVQS